MIKKRDHYCQETSKVKNYGWTIVCSRLAIYKPSLSLCLVSVLTVGGQRMTNYKPFTRLFIGIVSVLLQCCVYASH